MVKAFLTWYIISTSLSTILPWTSLPLTYSSNIFPEFSIGMWYVDATKVSRIKYNEDNKHGTRETIIIPSEKELSFQEQWYKNNEQQGKPNF